LMTSATCGIVLARIYTSALTPWRANITPPRSDRSGEWEGGLIMTILARVAFFRAGKALRTAFSAWVL
jgi:hypothetical protein